MRRWPALSLLAILLVVPTSWAQTIKHIGLPLIHNYSPEDFGAEDQIWDIAQDARGVMFFANYAGVLEFDGTRWRRIPLPRNGRAVAFVQVGKVIYVSGADEFGRLDVTPQGTTVFTSLMTRIPEADRRFGTVSNMVARGDDIVLSTADRLIIIGPRRTEVVRVDGRITEMAAIGDGVYVSVFPSRVFRLNGRALEPVRLSGLPDDRVAFILPFDDGDLLVGLRARGVYRCSAGSCRPFAAAIEPLTRDGQLITGTILRNGDLAFGTSSSGLFLTDRQGRVLQWIDKSRGLEDNSAYRLFQDREGNLWAGLGAGLAYLELNSPFSVIDQSAGYDNATYCLALLHGTLYGGGDTFLQTMNWSEVAGAGGAAPAPSRFEVHRDVKPQVWEVSEHFGQLFAAANNSVYLLAPRGVTRLPWSAPVFKLYEQPGRRDLLATTEQGFVLLEMRDGRWRFGAAIEGFEDSLQNSTRDARGRFWISVAHRGIYRVEVNLDARRVEGLHFYDSSKGLPSDQDNYASVLDGNVMASTRHGFYVFREATDRFEPFAPFNSVLKSLSAVYVHATDAAGNVWIRDERSLYLLVKQPDGSFRLLAEPFQRFTLPSTYGDVLPIDERNVIIGYKRSLIHYDPSYRVTVAPPGTTLIREARFAGGDAPGEGVDSNEFRYARNSVRFVFAAPAYPAGEKTTFRFQLEGFDREWSSWSRENQKDYTNLPEGHYRFRVQARDAFDRQFVPAEYVFRVLPPWYRSTWAYVGYLVMALASLHVGGILLSRRHRRERERLERLVALRTVEIKESEEARRKMEGRLQQSQKLESLGAMAGGIAHDFNNLLTGIMGNIELGLLDVPPGSAATGPLGQAMASSRRAAALTKQMLAYSGKGHFLMQPLGLNGVVREMTSMLQASLPTRATVDLVLEDPLPLVLADESQVQQVLVNLALNASEALGEEAGTITIRTGVGHFTAAELASPHLPDQLPDGRYVTLDVEDAGCGMDEDTLARVFDPFFTTKFLGRGLGLAAVLGIVRGHRGTIQIRSAPGQGTRVRIFFPATTS